MSAEVPKSIQINSEDVRFRDIHKNFACTEYGQKLKESVRWSRYMPEDMENHEWQKLLGYDVNNLEHLRLTYEISRWFIKHSKTTDGSNILDKEEQKLLKITAITHDWAESICGDTPLDFKTKNGEKKEMEYLLKIYSEQFGDSGFLLFENVKNIFEDKKSKLGMVFNAIENIGYIRTGLKAWKLSEKIGENELSLNHLKWLSENSFGNSISKLVEYSKIYTSVDIFLKRKKEHISKVFNRMPIIILRQYQTTNDKLMQLNKFEKAYTDWNQYQETKKLL